jgi:hypothetical protein
VHPHIDTEQPGLSPSAPKAPEGADYLRQLKNEAAQDAPTTPAAASRIVVPATTSFKERRRSPRLQCSGSAEFRPAGSDVRMWGTLTDVSLHGCYVEMNNTFPVGTRVSLTMEALGIRVSVQATVRVSYPFLGMGMCFSEIEPGQQLQLEQLLAALSGQSAMSNSASTDAPDANSTHSLADVDSKTIVDQLAKFFRDNRLLSRQEFYQIATRSRR